MRTITAMFDSRVDAETARDRLNAAGISADDVSIHDQSSLDAGSTGGSSMNSEPSYSTTTSRDSGQGLWSQIKSFFSGDEDVYAEGMRRGGFLLTARVDDAKSDIAMDILDDDGTIDLDARQQDWRKDGWAGNGGNTEMRTNDTAARNDDDVIPVIEEEFRVGTRDVSRGSVRVRSHVVETPVTQDVTLRSERVDVERRPVTGSRKVAAGDVDAMMTERTIEVRETAQEAVIDKRAVVREEIALTRHREEHVEKVSDTVRRTEVEVEHVGDNGSTGYGADRR